MTYTPTIEEVDRMLEDGLLICESCGNDVEEVGNLCDDCNDDYEARCEA